jgi:hypothetical protein
MRHASRLRMRLRIWAWRLRRGEWGNGSARCGAPVRATLKCAIMARRDVAKAGSASPRLPRADVEVGQADCVTDLNPRLCRVLRSAHPARVSTRYNTTKLSGIG